MNLYVAHGSRLNNEPGILHTLGGNFAVDTSIMNDLSSVARVASADTATTDEVGVGEHLQPNNQADQPCASQQIPMEIGHTAEVPDVPTTPPVVVTNTVTNAVTNIVPNAVPNAITRPAPHLPGLETQRHAIVGPGPEGASDVRDIHGGSAHAAVDSHLARDDVKHPSTAGGVTGITASSDDDIWFETKSGTENVNMYGV